MIVLKVKTKVMSIEKLPGLFCELFAEDFLTAEALAQKGSLLYY